MSNQILKYDVARKALAEAKSIDDVKILADKAEALQHYAKQIHDTDMEIWLAEIKIRAKRKLGEILINAKKDKKKWIKEARKSFKPSRRKQCKICGKHKLITEAHHIYHLSKQYDNGEKEINHNHIWLCPNHHKLIHLFLLDLTKEGDATIGKAHAVMELSENNELERMIEVLGGEV